MSANQTPNVAFADALERAKQIAAKLSQNPVKPADTFSTVSKRSAVDSGDEEPDAKKLANEPEVITPQLATLKAQQVAKQINQQLGILKSNEYSEDIKIGSNQTSIVRQSDIIKRLSEQYGVEISMEGNLSDNSSEKPIRITGNPEKVARVKQAIEQLASGGSLPTNTMQGVYGEYGNRTSDSVVIESQFNVPAEKAGIVIGKGGESIKDINRRSGAYVEIDRNQKPGGPGSFKIFNIRGTQEQITKAQHMIYDKCVNSPGGAPNMVPPPGHPSLQSQPTHTPNYNTEMHHFPHYSNPVHHHIDPYAAYPQAPMAAYPMQPAVASWPAYNPEPWQHSVPANTAVPGMCATSPMDPARSVTAMDWSTMYPGYYDPQQQAVQMMNTSIPVATPSVPTSAAVVSAPPVTNPQTGQPDYSLAWVEYYRSIGLHAQADYILSHAAQNNLISTGAGSSMPSSNGAVATSTVIPTAQDQQNQQSSGVITTAVDQSLNSQPWNNTSSVSQTSNPQSGLHPSQQPQLPQIHHHMQMGHQTPTGMPHQPMGSMPMQQPQMQPHLMHQQVSGMQQIPAAPPQMPPPPPPPSSTSGVHNEQQHMQQQQSLQSRPPLPPQQSQDGMLATSQWPHNLPNQ